MNPLLGLAGRFRPYLYLAAAIAVLVGLAWSYAQGRADGRAAEAVRWQQRENEAELQRATERAALQKAIEVRNAEIERREHAAADAVEQVRVEYLPAKTIVKRVVAERVVFRDCVIGGELRDTINTALRGAPTAGTPIGRGADGLPGAAPDNG